MAITSSISSGYAAALSGCAFYRVADGGRFRLIGPESKDFLHRMLTNDIRSLQPGQGAYAAMLDINGRMVADMWVWVLDEENVLVETSAEAQDRLVASLDKYLIMEQVEIADARATMAMVRLYGPHSHSAAQNALGTTIPELEAGAAWESSGGQDVVLASRYGHAAGHDLYISAALEPAFVETLAKTGAVGLSPDEANTLRVEAGTPVWGAELTTDTIPLEANLGGAGVSFSKGCYPGQEIIARIHARGKPSKHLMGIRFADGVPPVGAAVEQDGAAVGTITSAARSPRLGGIAMAYLRKEAGEAGRHVTAGGYTGETTELPFER